MIAINQCCGSCAWCEHDEIGDDWVYTNNASEYVADYVNYGHSCDEYEARERRKQ